jgi:glycine hydroxymethyltransferase
MSILQKNDIQLYELIKQETKRQNQTIELIASENFTSPEVLECLGSVLTNKYSEGRPNARYYAGNEFIDKIELLCEERALHAFNLDSNIWGVNVQPYSGSIANLAAFNSILNIGDKIMGLDLYSGGHLSHGFKTPKKKVNISSIIYDSYPYYIDNTGYIDYTDLELRARTIKPKLIICGGSAYPRDIDYERLRKIANLNNSYLLADIAHINGFIVTKLFNNPFEYCDIVTTTTHKTLRGPRSGMIFAKKENDLYTKVNESVFPCIQGGPHNHQIAALATQLREVIQPSFKEYMLQVQENARYLGDKLKSLGFKLSTDGTDNHILLVDLSNFEITGSKMERVCELVNISLNKNTVYGDKSALSPSGIRIGTTCMTTRNMPKDGWTKLAHWLERCIKICKSRQLIYGKKLLDFNKNIEQDTEIIALRNIIINYTESL